MPQQAQTSLDDKYGLEAAQPAGSSDDKYGLEPAIKPTEAPKTTPSAAPATTAAQPEKKPGFGQRFLESFGLPGTTKDIKTEIAARVPKTPGEAFKSALVEPILSNMDISGAIPSVIDYGKRIAHNVGEANREQKEALENISQGQPFLPNLAKGIEPIVKTGVEAVPFLGRPTYQSGEDFAHGNKAAGAGGLAGVITQVAAPELLKRGGPAVSAAAKKVGEPFHIGMTGEELVTKGVRPRSVAVNWDDAIARPGVQRELAEYNKGKPIQSMDDFHEAIPEIKEKIWKEQVEPALTRQKDRPVDMKPVGKAVRDTITPEMKRFEPDEATRMGNLADELDRAETIQSANRLLTYVNGKLESYFQKYPSARKANLLNNPETAGWESARQSIRKQFLDTLEGAGETQVRDARMDYGAMDTLGKEVERKTNIADRGKPWTLPRILGWMGAPLSGGLSAAAGEVMTHLNQPNVMVRRGIARMTPAEAKPFTPPPAYTPPAVPQAITGQQIPLNIPSGPTAAPLFNEVLSAPMAKAAPEAAIPKPAGPPPPPTAAPGPIGPAPKPFVKAQVPKEGAVFKGTRENIGTPEQMMQEPPRPEASVKIPNPKAVELNPGETTQERFFNKDTNKWSPERAANHQAYVDSAVKGKTAPTDRPPEAIITVGGTGAGKTTLTRRILSDNKNLVNIDPDANKLLIPEYEGLKKSDPQKAAFRVHEESSSMAKQLLQRAVQNGLDFVYDHTTGGGANSEKLYQKLKDAGYKVRIVYADLPVDEAINRARIRAESSADPVNRGRVVPENIIRQKHQEAANAFLKLQNHPAVDEISAYDTTTREPQQFYNRTGDKENIYQPEALERIRQKAGANAPVGKK